MLLSYPKRTTKINRVFATLFPKDLTLYPVPRSYRVNVTKTARHGRLGTRLPDTLHLELDLEELHLKCKLCVGNSYSWSELFLVHPLFLSSAAI